MKKTMKSILGIVIAMFMACTLLSISAFAAEANVAQIGETGYETLAAAINAATPCDTITLLADVTENVTVSKDLTIDGNDNAYTGKMTLNKINVTIQNVNFVAGQVYKHKNTGNGGNYTIKNCDFDGQGLNDYAINLGGTSNIVIEDCTAANYGYGLLQVSSSNVHTTVKNVDVSNVAYGFKVDYSNGVTMENVTITGSTVAGVLDSNYGAKTYTIKNCSFSGAAPLGMWDRNTGIKDTFLFVGNNTLDGDLILENMGILKLAEDATLAASADLDVTTDVVDGEVKYENGVYSVVIVPDVAAIGDATYKTLAEAITVANTGDTITLLADVTENVTITKKLTLDGADNQYTGKISVNGGLTVTVKNIQFVNSYIETASNTKTSLTISNCDFVGAYAANTYAVKMAGGSKLTIENCDAKDLAYGLAYVNKAVTNVTYKNVNIDGATYGLHVAYGTNVNLENVTMQNVAYGVYTQTYGAKTFTFTNCTIDATTSAVSAYYRAAKTQTLKFLGVNDFGTTDLTFGSAYIKSVAAARIGTKIYDSLTAAVAAAQDGDVITVIVDTAIASDEAIASGVYGSNYKTYIEVLDKNITIDFNGKTVTINPAFDGTMLAAIFVGNTGALALKDSSEAQTGGLIVNAETNTYTHSCIFVDGSTSYLSIEGGNYRINRIDHQSMLYPAQTGTTYISGGNFVLDNAGEREDTQPWIYNTWLSGENFVEVTGGTYNAYPQNRWNEVKLPYCYKIVENENGTYSVVYAPAAQIGETDYASLADAVEAAQDGDTIVVIDDITLDNNDIAEAVYEMYPYLSVTDKQIIIDLNGKVISAVPEFDKPLLAVLYVGGTGDVTLKDSSADQTGAINVTMGENTAAYSLLFADGATSKLSIESGNYYIDKVTEGYSMIYVAQTGTGVVSGGNFVLDNAGETTADNGAQIPWIFNTWQNGKNFVKVTGGTYNADPDNFWHEAKFPKGYVSAENADGTWNIVRGPIIVNQPTDITVGYNKMAKFAPEIKGDGLTYTWYYKDATNTRFYKSTLTTATYDIKGLAARDGRQIYCVATDCTGRSVTTDIVTLHVVPNEELAIVSQPTVVEGTLNKNVTVALDVTGDDLTYVWYYSDNGGKNFYKSTLKTATYDIILKQERMGRVVYCQITDAFGETVTSEWITINAVQSVELKVNDVEYVAAKVGKTAKINLDVQGEGLTYTWYYTLPGKTTPYKSTITDSTYSITLSADRIGRTVYCVVTDAFGNSVKTETVTLTAAE